MINKEGLNSSQQMKLNYEELQDILESPRVTTLSKKNLDYIYDLETRANDDKKKLRLSEKQEDWFSSIYKQLFN